MDDLNKVTRLRNACDACHKLKRRCTGTMPCKNCAALGSSCLYSVASRLGRPRGSKSRHNASSRESSRTAKSTSVRILTTDAGSDAFNDMLDLEYDGFDAVSSYQLSTNPYETSDAAISQISMSETDTFQDLDQFFSDSSSLSQCTSVDTGSSSVSVHSVDYELQLQPQIQPQQKQHHHDHHSAGLQSEPQPQAYQSQKQQYTQRNPFQSLRCGSIAPSCQCIPELSSLLHGLKRQADNKRPPAELDHVLFTVSGALAQLSAHSACPRCSNHDGADDDLETLLLAALSMRRIIAQVKAADFRQGVNGLGETEGEDISPYLHVGAFEVTGSDRTMLLGVLRTITVRKLKAAVATMQSMLQTKQTRGGKSESTMLRYVESILDEASKSIESQ